MSVTKKAISLILCVVMMMSMVVIGLHASADGETPVSTVRTYQSLVDEYGTASFVYVALRLYDASGNEIADNGVLNRGTEYAYKVFVKTNLSLDATTKIPFAYDSKFFSSSDTKNGSVKTLTKIGTTGNTSGKKAFALDGTAHSEIVNSTGYSNADIADWAGFNLTLQASSADYDYTKDDAIFNGKLKVLETATTGEVVLDESFLAVDVSNKITYTLKDKYSDGTSYPGKIVSGGSDYIKYENSKNKPWANIIIDDKSTINVASDAEFDITYVYSNGEQAADPATAKINDPIPLPTVDGVYAWSYNGKVVKSTDVVTGNMELVAVPDSTPVNIILDAGEGTINGQPSQTIQVTIGEGDVDLSSYVAAPPEGATYQFKCWKDGDGNYITGEFVITSLDDITLTAVWAGTLSLDVKTFAGETVNVGTYLVPDGQKLTSNDYVAIMQIYAGKQSEISALTGADAINAEIVYDQGDGTYAAEIPVKALGSINTTPLYVDGYANTIRSNAITGYSVNGEGTQITELLLNAVVAIGYDVYVPVFNEDGTVKENAEDKFGKDWANAGTVNGKFEAIKGYKNSSSTNIVDAYGADGFSPLSESVYNNAAANIDTSVYTINLHDGNGTPMKITQVSKANFDEGSNNHISFYLDVAEKIYHIGLYTNKTKGDKTAKRTDADDLAFGASFTIDSFDKINLPGGEPFAISVLYEDGEPVDNKGYKLSKVYYLDANGNEVELAQGTSITIDKDFLELMASYTDADNNIYFFTEWEVKYYDVTVYYYNANSQWTELATKSLAGNETVNYNNMIAEYIETIENDVPESLMISKNEISKTGEFGESGGNTGTQNISVSDAEDNGGKLDVYVTYIPSLRSAFVDFNNGKDEEGNIREDITGNNVRYVAYNNNQYGTLLYDPDYDPETSEKMPLFASYENFYVESYPEETDAGVDAKADTKERPYRNCEYIGYKVFYTDGIYDAFEDLPDQSEWKEGYNDQNESGQQHLYTTTILQLQWMNDKDFFFRVYDDTKTIAWALGKNFKTYYWAPSPIVTLTTATVGTKADVVHCRDEENNINILFLPKKDIDGSWYFYHLSIAKTWLNLLTYGNLIPVIIELLKSGMIKDLLN